MSKAKTYLIDTPSGRQLACTVTREEVAIVWGNPEHTEYKSRQSFACFLQTVRKQPDFNIEPTEPEEMSDTVTVMKHQAVGHTELGPEILEAADVQHSERAETVSA